jgi:predicted GIY-YIG superfamily endonuclease
MAVVYRHIRLDKNEPFYIGISKNMERPYDKHRRNKHWKSIINRTGYRVDILFDNLPYEEAKKKEVEFISLYGRKDLGLGTLCNMTDGGEGTFGLSKNIRKVISDKLKGYKHSQETKEKMKISNSGKNVGRKRSDETRNKISQVQMGKKHSNETKNKMSEAHKGRKKGVITEQHKNNLSNSIKIKEYGMYNGIFYSVKELATMFNVKEVTIRQMKSGKIKNRYNIDFMYKNKLK